MLLTPRFCSVLNSLSYTAFYYCVGSSMRWLFRSGLPIEAFLHGVHSTHNFPQGADVYKVYANYTYNAQLPKCICLQTMHNQIHPQLATKIMSGKFTNNTECASVPRVSKLHYAIISIHHSPGDAHEDGDISNV